MLSREQLDDVYKALCANGLSASVASFLTDMLARIEKLESRDDD